MISFRKTGHIRAVVNGHNLRIIDKFVVVVVVVFPTICAQVPSQLSHLAAAPACLGGTLV